MEELRNLLLSNIQMPESVYVNVDGKKNFDVIQKTVEGSIDHRQYSLVRLLLFCKHGETWSGSLVTLHIIAQSTINALNQESKTSNAKCNYCATLH